MGEWNKRLLEGADQLAKCWKHLKAYVVYRGENELAKMASNELNPQAKNQNLLVFGQ